MAAAAVVIAAAVNGSVLVNDPPKAMVVPSDRIALLIVYSKKNPAIKTGWVNCCKTKCWVATYKNPA